MEGLGEVLEQHPMFGGKLWEMLIKEAGASHGEQSAFIEENIALVDELVEGEASSKRHTHNNEPTGVGKPASVAAAGQMSGDAEGVSEHDPG